MPLKCRPSDVTAYALSEVDLTATIGGSGTSWFDTLRFWNRVHPGACASKVVGKRPSDWVICVVEEG